MLEPGLRGAADWTVSLVRAVIVLLASGLSRRLGRPKQLLDYRGKPLIRHVAEIAISAGANETIVVVPAGQFRDLLADLPVTLIENPDAEEGISAAIRRAVEAAGEARILFTVCDQPRVTAAHLRAILDRSAPIVATGYSSIAGVPAAFDPGFAPELLALRGDRGARSVIQAHPDALDVIPFPDAAFDVDTEDDYRRV